MESPLKLLKLEPLDGLPTNFQASLVLSKMTRDPCR